MITKDGSIMRVAPKVVTSAIRHAMLDEDGHIRELSAAAGHQDNGQLYAAG